MTNEPTLYLIPVPLAEVEHRTCLPEYNREVVGSLKHFVVENIRSARRFLKAVDRSIDINSLTFFELNKHTSPEDVAAFLAPMRSGESLGVISEAGCPAVADPGSDVVALAQREGYRVEPLVGPSSILLALMGSGFNGQRFAFLGYLPIDDAARAQAIRDLEHRLLATGETQIFIETPYRNEKLVEELVRLCKPSTRLCIASEVTSANALIQTRALSQWRGHIPAIHKKPTIFVLGR
ncbi:SAM-dependent methyltransferase [Porphyromonas sp. COT-290 OH860]|uniref:SAM-dependent methyltransferase n=1 Tax=Porphyromonas sp. COT-290 OH860 TaxID=1515615 RepID=UPI00052D4525|nr:SAM-dependent methyltransferase [Porphyromonas sp. COT-290 OH860]KGN84869.1 SAM-dependent methyltransferase [Porphyromonas sp. COT-290 OH860]